MPCSEFPHNRRQLPNVCTLGIHQCCMDWAPKHMTELQRDQQNFQNTSRSQTCKTWIQLSTTHSNAQEKKIMLHSALSLRKKKMLGPTTRMRRNERSNMGFTDTIPYLLLEGEDRRRRWQDKDSLFVPYWITFLNQTGKKNFEEWLIYVELNSSLQI